MISIRDAGLEDVPILAIHHRTMFEEILSAKGRSIDSDRLDDLEQNYARKLRKQFPAGDCKVWIAENEGHIAASGGVTLMTTVPVPDDPSSRIAYLHSMFTDKSFRKMGLAQRIVETALDYCRSIGIRRVILNASDAGRPLYEKLGFELADNAMRFWIA